MPVAVAALIWSVCVLVILLSPPASAGTAVVIVAGLLAVGGLYFAYLMIFRRRVLESEPGEPMAI